MRSTPMPSSAICCLALFSSLASALPQISKRATSNAVDGLSASKTTMIRSLLDQTANKSWEVGTHVQALTEFDYPALAPFYDTFAPVPSSPTASSVFAVISPIIRQKSSSSLQIMPDGSAADPASIGVAVVLANWTAPEASSGGVSRQDYATAAEDQLKALLEDTPRTNDGAISHRVEELALWSDFIYMVPPFLAYYGVVNSNASLIQEAYRQCELYRQYLRTPETGLWRHILWGPHPDPGLWATGNGWAAAGMLRVVASIINSDYKDDFTAQTNNLTQWVIEIVEASFKLQMSNQLFHNYVNETNTFGDAASAALLTSVSYRLAQLKLSTSTIQQAETTRVAIYNHISASTGVLSPVVDPLSYGQQGRTTSPEAEAFVLLMESAWRDWKLMSDTPGQGGGVNPNNDTSFAVREVVDWRVGSAAMVAASWWLI